MTKRQLITTVAGVTLATIGSLTMFGTLLWAGPAPVVHAHHAPVARYVAPVLAPVTTTTPTTVAPTTTTTAPPVVATTVPPPTTTTTTQPGLAPGWYPTGPSQTIEVTNCYVTWIANVTDPVTGAVTPSKGSYGGNCAEAAQVASWYPGSVVTQVTDPETTGAAS